MLPPVAASYISTAAFRNQSSTVAVGYPRGMPVATSVKAASFDSMMTSHMKIVEEAYACVRGVTTLAPSDSLDLLLKADEKELCDNANKIVPPDSTIAPRSLSITGLTRGPCKNGLSLLNALSHLAGTPDATPAATHCRFAFLAGVDSETYLKSRAASFPEDFRLPAMDKIGQTAVVVSWAKKSGPNVILFSKFVEILGCGSGSDSDTCDTVTEKLAAVLDSANVVPCGSFFAIRSSCPPNAFVEMKKAVSESFQKLVLPEPSVRLSAYTTSSDYDGPLDFSDIWLRLLPKGQAVTSPSVSYGLLLHQSGKTKETAEFLRQLRSEEESEMYGLRPPCGIITEDALALHVLTAFAEPVLLGPRVSSYGFRGVPGKRLSLNEGASVWSVRRSILAITPELLSGFFLLPTSQETCKQEVDSLNDPLFQMFEKAVKDTVLLFEETGPTSRAASVVSSVVSRGASVVSVRAPPSDPRDRLILSAIGLLECPSEMLGDVVTEMKHRRMSDTSLCRFLMASIAKLGAEASVADVFEVCRTTWTTQDTRVNEIGARLAAAEAELESLRSTPMEVSSSVSTGDATSYTDGPLTQTRQNNQSNQNNQNDQKQQQQHTLSDTGVSRLIASCGLKAGSGGVILNDTADTTQKVILVVCKSLGKKKKNFNSIFVDSATVESNKLLHDQRSRVTTAAEHLVKGVDTSLFLLVTDTSLLTSVYMVRPSEDTMLVGPSSVLNSPAPHVLHLKLLNGSQQLMYYESASE